MSATIERSLADHLSLHPQAEAVLRGLPPNVLFLEEHGLKHPLATYVTSLNQIESAWMQVLDLYEKVRLEVALEGKSDNELKLVEKYQSLLERLNEHVDSGHQILRCLRPPIAGLKAPTHSVFLDKTHLPGWSEFKRVIHEKYRVPRLGNVVNVLKYENAILRAIHGTSGSSVVLGYFVEGPRGKGVVGPHVKVHKPWRNFETAFSFAFDMLTHFYWLYEVSESICASIAKTMEADHHLTATPRYQASSAGSLWSTLCLRVSNLGLDFFPDERVKRRPVVACVADLSRLTIKTDAPGRTHWPEAFRISATMFVVEEAMTVMPPYFPKRG